MTLPLPNLDDHSYAKLVEEAISQIPVEYPEWTDHNPTDTGIILIELFAWLTEMVLYRVNQIPDENYASFLSLLQGEEWNLPINVSPEERQKALQLKIQHTLLDLRQIYRAITSTDYEKLVLMDWNQSITDNNLKIARVKCLAQRNLELTSDNFAKGHISLVVLPANNQIKQVNKYQPLFEFIEARTLLTTRLHIVEPEYISIAIETELVLQDGAQAEAVKTQAQTELAMFFAPIRSGKYWQGKGWSFGRSVYLSELYKILDELDGVDYVNKLQINNKSDAETYLADNQLVMFNFTDSKFTILVEVGNGIKTI